MERPLVKLGKFRLPQMRRSKLEMYLDTIKVLAHNGPLKQTNIISKVNLNCNILNEHLSFLIKHELVEERNIQKRKTIFVITQNGITVLKYFRELEQVPPIID